MEIDLYVELVNFIRDSAALEATLLIALVAILLITLLVVHFGPKIVFRLYESSTLAPVQLMMTKFVYSLDLLADEMSHKEKRDAAILKLQSVLTFRGLRLPRFIYGWVIDVLVSNIRDSQAQCVKESDLHKDDTP